ncbi:MAG: HAD family phosphatase [Candidatus Aegiribacteria sp.]|nr:HAD family phosphatase [Candidatus Aegiribacteria sp.]
MARDSRPAPVGIFATDFDGTLHMPGRDFHREDILALECLGRMNILRVIATGRSPFSFDRMMGERSLPVDYLVLSSGAGIQDYRTGEFLWTASANEALTSNAVSRLRGSGYDFCVQGEFPRNHLFTYNYSSGTNPDLERRINLYAGFCRQIRKGDENSASTQIVIIVPPGRQDGVVSKVTESLGESYNILRTTSPLDGESLWVEVFPAGVSKSSGVEWLAARFGLSGSDAAAVGNDYNDHDLLQWARHAFVVENSPEHLRTHFREVHSVNEGGVAQAARLWLIETGQLSNDDCWPV